MLPYRVGRVESGSGPLPHQCLCSAYLCAWPPWWLAAPGGEQALPLFRAELRQMPEKGDERPDLLGAGGGTKGGHAGGHDAIGDDPEQYAIAGGLDGDSGQRRRFRGEVVC